MAFPSKNIRNKNQEVTKSIHTMPSELHFPDYLRASMSRLGFTSEQQQNAVFDFLCQVDADHHKPKPPKMKQAESNAARAVLNKLIEEDDQMARLVAKPKNETEHAHSAREVLDRVKQLKQITERFAQAGDPALTEYDLLIKMNERTLFGWVKKIRDSGKGSLAMTQRKGPQHLLSDEALDFVHEHLQSVGLNHETADIEEFRAASIAALNKFRPLFLAVTRPVKGIGELCDGWCRDQMKRLGRRHPLRVEGKNETDNNKIDDTNDENRIDNNQQMMMMMPPTNTDENRKVVEHHSKEEEKEEKSEERNSIGKTSYYTTQERHRIEALQESAKGCRNISGFFKPKKEAPARRERE